jgi:hypothetical protein
MLNEGFNKAAFLLEQLGYDILDFRIVEDFSLIYHGAFMVCLPSIVCRILIILILFLFLDFIC